MQKNSRLILGIFLIFCFISSIYISLETHEIDFLFLGVALTLFGALFLFTPAPALTKEFFFPSTPAEIYDKTIEHLKRRGKIIRDYEFIIEEENPSQFIKFRILGNVYELGNYGRSSSITITPNDKGSRVIVTTPKAVADIPYTNIRLSDDMLMIYEFMGGNVSDSVLREIYSIGEVNGSIIEGLIFLLFLFGFYGYGIFSLFETMGWASMIVILPLSLLFYVFFSPLIVKVLNRVRIRKAFLIPVD